MLNLPFKIPLSLAGYAERFESEPEMTISRLRAHLRKRGPDAVGYFLLAWLHHLSGDVKSANRAALQAKAFAAGSPLMQHLHYFLKHPDSFDAAVPDQAFTSVNRPLQSNRPAPDINLDELIDLLETVESKHIQIPQDGQSVDDSDLSELSNDIDDIASETLAKIHAEQGKKKEAIKIYEQLIKLNSDKKEFYAEEIKKLS